MTTTPLDIFLVFFKMSCVSFGGVFGMLPLLEKWIVIDHAWITHARFTQAYAIGSFLPGPNMVMCPLIGYWICGWRGFWAAFAGIYSMPLVAMGAVSFAWHHWGAMGWLTRAERALRPAAIGLILSSAAHLIWTTSSGNHTAAFALAVIVWITATRKTAGTLTIILAAGFVWTLFALRVGV